MSILDMPPAPVIWEQPETKKAPPKDCCHLGHGYSGPALCGSRATCVQPVAALRISPDVGGHCSACEKPRCPTCAALLSEGVGKNDDAT